MYRGLKSNKTVEGGGLREVAWGITVGEDEKKIITHLAVAVWIERKKRRRKRGFGGKEF